MKKPIKKLRNMWKELCFKNKLSFILCIIAFSFGIILASVGMILPPLGVIDGSVITCFGMLLTFVGSILGISQHYAIELEKIKSEISNNNSNEQN